MLMPIRHPDKQGQNVNLYSGENDKRNLERLKEDLDYSLNHYLEDLEEVSVPVKGSEQP